MYIPRYICGFSKGAERCCNLSKNFIDSVQLVVPPLEYIAKLNLAAIIEQMILNTKEMISLEELVLFE